MAQFTLSIDAIGGPLLTVIVAVSQHRAAALQQAGQPIPQLQVIRALVDTGASCTCVDPSVLRALELQPTGSIPIATPSTGHTPHMAEQYDIALLIPGVDQSHQPLFIATMPVVAAELDVQGFHALIGRDTLSRCVLIYNGDNGTFTLAF